MTTSTIVINLVLSVAVTALVASIAFFVPFLLDRPAKRHTVNVAPARPTSVRAADRESAQAA